MDKLNSDRIYYSLGVLGALTIIFGNTQANPHTYYIVGSIALLFTALHFGLVFYTALEFILIAGYSSFLLGISFYTRVALPILLSFQLFVFYYMLGKQNNLILIIGILGIALLSVGFSSNNQWISFSGSLAIAIYSFYSALRKAYPCYIWAFLNTVLTASTFYKLIL